MTSFYHKVKECSACKVNYLVSGLRSFNSLGAEFYTDGSISNCSLRAERLLVCPKCSAHEWLDDVRTIKMLTEIDYMNLLNEYVKDRFAFLNAMPEFFGSSPSGILLLLKEEPWRCKDEELYLRLCLWRAVGRLHLECKDNSDSYRDFKERQVLEYASSQPLKAAEALHALGRNDECRSFLENQPLKGQLEENMLRLLELNEYNELMSAELLRQMGRFDEAVHVLSLAFPKNDNACAKKIAELAAAGCKWLGVVP